MTNTEQRTASEEEFNRNLLTDEEFEEEAKKVILLQKKAIYAITDNYRQSRHILNTVVTGIGEDPMECDKEKLAMGVVKLASALISFCDATDLVINAELAKLNLKAREHGFKNAKEMLAQQLLDALNESEGGDEQSAETEKQRA